MAPLDGNHPADRRTNRPRSTRALLVVHGPAGDGSGRARAAELLRALSTSLGAAAEVALRVAESHDEVREHARAFAAATGDEGLLLAGGGGGTLRAMVEASVEGAGGVTPIAPLRLGSGNLLAKRLGVARDPARAVVEAARAFACGRVVHAGVLRARIGREDGGEDVAYANALCGLGLVGEVPSAVSEWKARFATLHRAGTRALGVERITDLAYAGCLAARAARELVSLEPAPLVELRAPDAVVTTRLLAGVALSYPVKNVPLVPGVDVEDEACALSILPASSPLDAAALLASPAKAARGARRFLLTPGRSLELTLLDRDRAAFFLDEDPLVFFGRLRLEAGGRLPFVPGLHYAAAPSVTTAAPLEVTR